MKKLLVGLLLFSMELWSVPTNFYYQGVATDNAGIAITGPINLKVQIGALDSGNVFCILWEETITSISVSSGGSFQVPVGSTASTYNISFENALSKLTFSGVSPASSCGTSFSVLSPRFLRVYYDTSGSYVALSPDVSLASAPFAAVSQTLQGKVPADLVQVNPSTQLSQSNLETIFSAGNYPILSQLLAGTSSLYATTTDFSTVQSFSKTALPTCTGGQVLTGNGTALSCVTDATGGGGGTVTNVTSTNSYLSVATSTTTPALTLNVGTTSNTVAAGNDSRITGAAQLTSANTFSSGGQNIYNVGVATVPLTVRGAAGQTANLMEMQNSSSTVLYSFAPGGTPSVSTDLIPKGYLASNFLATTGGSVSGALTVSGNFTGNATIKSSSGTSASPAVTSSINSTTGIYYPSSGDWAVSNNGTSSLIIKASRNVGIGTTTPAFPLDVGGDIQASGILRTTNSGYGLYQTSSGINLNSYIGGGYGVLGTESAHKLALQANNIEAITILPDGKVGISTIAPTTALQVAGVIAPASNNTYTLGSPTFRFTEVYATNGVINTSDRREKKEIYDSDLGLNFIRNLRPVSYRWVSGKDKDIHYGLIAQEAEQAIKDAKGQAGDNITSIVTHDKDSDRYGVRYSELIAPLIKSVQQLFEYFIGMDREIAYLKLDNEAKTKQINELTSRLEKIENTVKLK